MALGLGLTLFATLAVIETNFNGQINRTIPTKAPSYFVLDIPKDDIDRFRNGMTSRCRPAPRMTVVPSLRGPVTAVNGVPGVARSTRRPKPGSCAATAASAMPPNCRPPTPSSRANGGPRTMPARR